MSNKKNSSEHRRRTSRTIQGESRTQRHLAAETDINNIVKRYLPTGALPGHGKQPMYGDFTSIDYMAMQNAIADIDQQFASLPARLRGRFQNDPYQLIRFVEKPENQKEAVRLGLLVDPNQAFGLVDKETGLEGGQTDLMTHAETLDAMDPGHKSHDPEMLAEILALAAKGDQESQLLVDTYKARVAAKKAVKARKTPPKGEEGGT